MQDAADRIAELEARNKALEEQLALRQDGPLVMDFCLGCFWGYQTLKIHFFFFKLCFFLKTRVFGFFSDPICFWHIKISW